MYVEIKENKLLSWCENPYLDYEQVDIDYETFDKNKYEVQDGILIDISNTDEYKTKVTTQEREATLANLKSQIEEIDKKRIRAMAEPSLYDVQSGKTWLQHYNEQISELREQILQL